MMRSSRVDYSKNTVLLIQLILQNTLKDLEKELVVVKVGEGTVREFRMDVSTLLCVLVKPTRTYVQCRELCSVSCTSLDGRGAWRRMDSCICMAESLCYLPETITAWLISYIPTQNKKFKTSRGRGHIMPMADSC